MPNWCDNWAEIEGPEKKIQALYDAGMDQQNKGLLEHMAPIGNWDYDDAVTTWGTKWEVDINEMAISKTDNGRAVLKGYFQSAWGPPTEAFKNYMLTNADIWNMDLSFYEPAMDFAGSLAEGVVTISEEGRDFFLNNDHGKHLSDCFPIIEDFDDMEEDAMEEAIKTPPCITVNPDE